MSVVSILAKSSKMPLEISKIDFLFVTLFTTRTIFAYYSRLLRPRCNLRNSLFFISYCNTHKLNYSQEKCHDIRIAELFA